ncbi:MAG: PatB family C-S lyase [Trueperaceae bacterium]
MAHSFDDLQLDALRARPLAKWRVYDPDVLPLWVADMDFPVAEPIRAAIRAYADGDLWGYPSHGGLPGVRETVCDRMRDRYGWEVEPDHVVLLPGIVAGLYGGVRAFASHGEGVVTPTPVYPPFRAATESQGRLYQSADLAEGPDGYRLDGEALDAAITPASRLLMLCHPHNPTGRVFDASELEALADRVIDHRLWVVSDELHADLNFGPQHRPFATVAPEVATRTVTLVGPTKAFNIAGLKVGFAIATDPETRERFRAALAGLAGPGPSVAQLAAKAAWSEADDWLDDTLAYLRANRDHVHHAVRERLPGVRMHLPEATYLAWLDFRNTVIADDPAGALLERGRLALNPGPSFGEAGRGFARLNFATSRGIVDEGLDRIARVLHEG